MEKYFDTLSARISVAETLVKFLLENSSKESVVGRTMEVECVSNSLEKGEKEFDTFKEGKRRELVSEEEESSLKRKRLGQAGGQRIRHRARKMLKMMESKELDLRAVHESLAERERKVGMIVGTLDERISAVEKREKEFNLFLEGKMREMMLREEQLRLKWGEFVEQGKLADAKFREQEELKNAVVEKLELAENKLETVKADVDERLKEIEFRENVACESVALILKEADSIRESLEKRVEEIEEMRSEFNSYQEDKMRELDSKEKLLNGMSEDIRELMEKRVEEIEKMKSEFNSYQEDKIRELDSKEKLLNRMSEDIRELMGKRVEEIEKMKSEFNSYQEDKMRELDSKERLLNGMSEEFVKNAKLRNQELIKQERSVNQLLKKLYLANNNVEGLKRMVDERFREVRLREIEAKSVSDWIEKKMDEMDYKAKELKKKEEGIDIKEASVMHEENELREKEKRLWALQQDLEAKQKEVESSQQLNEQRSKKIDAKEKSLNSVRECVNKCFKKHLDIKRRLNYEKYLVEKTARFLGLTDESLDHALRKLEFREKQTRDHVEEQELEQQRSLESDDSVNLKFAVRMDGKNLQMFLNDSERDLESMGDEIFTVLHLSSDPAKLVLDALEGFYPPHLREGDTAFTVRRTCIALLKQLIKMSRNIKPHVGEEAFELATTWKSKMSATVRFPSLLEVLGFLFLLAAYNIGSFFDKDEISSLLKMVAQHRETAELCRILGFPEISAGERKN